MDILEFFKSLSDDTRLRCILLITHESELCVCELTVALDDLQPKISRHLALLKQTGLVLDRKEGLWVYYRLNPTIPDWAKHTLYTSYKQNLNYISKNLDNLAKMDKRPDRANVCRATGN